MIDIINELFDKNTFVQTNSYIVSSEAKDKKSGDGVFTGYGSVNGRAVFAAFQDENYLNGAVGLTHAKKISNCIDMAVKVGAPFVFYMTSAGGRISEGLDVLNGYGLIVKSITAALGVIPVIAVVDGNCIGISSIIASSADFSFVTENSYIAFSGPDAIKASGSKSSNSTKSITKLCNSRKDAFEAVRELMCFIPDNCNSLLPDEEGTNDFNKSINADGFGTFEEYDVKELISSLADNGNWFEIYDNYAENVVTGFAFIGGKVCALVANQPKVINGDLNISACEKISSVLAFCDKFNIPVITLTNTQGFTVSEEEEKAGLSASAALLISSFANSDMPKINIITGKAYGSSYLVMNGKNTGADIVYAWNSADISVITPEAGALLIFNEEIKSSNDPVKTREECIDKYRKEYSTAYYAAEKGLVDDIINPSETRARIISALYLLD